MVNSKRLHSTPLLTSKFSKYEGWPYSAVYVNSMAFSHYCRFTPSSTVGKPTLQDPTSPAFPFPTTAPFLHHVEVWRVVWFSQNETFWKKKCVTNPLCCLSGDDTLKIWDIRNFKKPLNMANGLTNYFAMWVITVSQSKDLNGATTRLFHVFTFSPWAGPTAVLAQMTSSS